MLNFLMHVIFNKVFYIFWVHFYEFEMNLMNIDHPKHFKSNVTNIFTT